jgi:hypothetical protein
MSKVRIQLDHMTVQATDRKASAKLLAHILGVAWAEETGIGPFSAVYVNDGLTLDFDEGSAPFPVSHYCFRVGDLTFDEIVVRLASRSIAYRSTPHGSPDGRINTAMGGRIVYWSEPDGHVWEALTASYARPKSA